MSVILNFILMLLIWHIKDSIEIRNVKLIVPTIVQAGSSATLLCLYDLEGASLYSIQWYRGRFEFFRLIPNENPPIKMFPIPGLDIDAVASNGHQVTLRNISVHISGEFSCEITTDTFPFSTSCVSKNLTVVDFALELKTIEKNYTFGDVIFANCTLIPKLPSTKLVFHWNNKPVPNKYINICDSNSVSLHLNSSLFDARQLHSVSIQLRCSALLDNLYYIVSKSVSLKMKPSSLSVTSEGIKPSQKISFTILYTIFVFVVHARNYL